MNRLLQVLFAAVVGISSLDLIESGKAHWLHSLLISWLLNPGDAHITPGHVLETENFK